MTTNTATRQTAESLHGRRNPGPSWGYRFIRFCDTVVPETVLKPIRALATWVALGLMPGQRRHSREYLRIALNREPTIRDVFRHFCAFEESLLLKLRVIDGLDHRCDLAPTATGFRDWLEHGYPALLGTFHVGPSDLLGFLLGEREKRRVHLVRLRVGNSHDTDRLSERFREWVKIVWINEPNEMLFALKEAAETSDAIAMQCDRVEFSARAEAFDFLGARRKFPFTIYHLAHVFQRPVILSVGKQIGATQSLLYDSPVFRPDPAQSREVTVARGREHFQEFLHQLEGLLRSDPYIWFNFTPLNPPVEETRI